MMEESSIPQPPQYFRSRRKLTKVNSIQYFKNARSHQSDWLSAGHSVFTWKGSSLSHVWAQTLASTLITTIIAIFYLVDGINFLQPILPASTLVISILGVTMGLLLGFRTNTAYERYWEGRKTWSVLQTNCRNLSRNIWLGVKEVSPEDMRMKRGAMNLCIAIMTSTKNYLRLENRGDSDDVGPFTSHLPTSEGKQLENTVIPLEIVNYLTGYIQAIQKRNIVNPNFSSGMLSSLTAITDVIGNFERIQSTPIPFAYRIHLKQVTIMYLGTLPFQLVGITGWSTIFLVTVATFTFLGVENIGSQIENPFGYDENDLPMDEFCDDYREEVISILGGSKDHFDCSKWLKPSPLILMN